MPIDITRFRESFYAEINEHVEALESTLLAIDLAAPAASDLDAIFRAVHSIKGGSGTFGLPELAGFTHGLETLLDRVRAGTQALTPRIVDLTLRAGDVIRDLTAAYAAHAAIDLTAAELVTAEIEALAGDAPTFAPRSVTAGGQQVLAIDIVLHDTRNPELFAAFRAALEALGTLDAPPLPDAAGAWHARLTTERTATDVRELFAFISMPLDRIEVRAASDPPAAPAAVFGFFDEEPATAPVAAPAGPATNGSAAGGTIRVATEKIDHLVNLVGELVIAESMLVRAIATSESATPEMHAALEAMQHHTRDLRERVMSVRMIPIGTVFSRFGRVTHELAAKLGKRVRLQLAGSETELDKGLIEKLTDPLTHLVRNSLDHGIEAAEIRAAAGKPAEGTIWLRAAHAGGSIEIEIEDDGGGIDPARIIAKAHERGLAIPDDPLALIFEAGFSTAAEVSDLSGRGVGMDVVRRNVHDLGGRIEIDSVLGRGTKVTIRLPLTLAILDGLSVRVGEETFILPIASIVESVQPRAADIQHLAAGSDLLAFRGEFVPIVPLRRAYGVTSAGSRYEDGICVVVDGGSRRGALFVDALEAQHQVVIKSLESNFRRVPGIAGATVMGNGRVALIVDVDDVLLRS